MAVRGQERGGTGSQSKTQSSVPLWGGFQGTGLPVWAVPGQEGQSAAGTVSYQVPDQAGFFL